MLTSSSDLAILKGVIGFARAFECGLVAEGVETLEHSQLLMELGCECGQGYYIAKPMPARAFFAWIDEWYQTEFQAKYKTHSFKTKE